jgi:hypothetical protein
VAVVSAALEEVWTEQRRWSKVAVEAGDQLGRWRVVNMWLLVIGATLSALGAQTRG